MSMLIKRVLAGLVVLAIAAGVSTILLVAPSQAAGKMLKLSYSPNGPWLDNLPSAQANVTDDELLVPADEVQQTFYTYNSTGAAGKLTLACAVSDEVDDDFAAQLQVSYAVGAVGAVDPDSFVSCEGPSLGVAVPGRRSREVQVKVALADVNEQTAQDMTANIDILVTLAGVLPERAGGRPTVLGAEDFGNKPTSTSNGGTTANAGTSIPCDDPTRTVVTVVGQPRCPAVAGAQAFAGSKKSTTGTLNTFAPLVGSTEPRSTTTLLPLALGLLLAGGLLITLRRFASARRSRPTE